MTVNTDIQYRGNCQVCGRLQAILIGEKRKSESGRILECTSVNGPRVHWKCANAEGKTFKGWTGSSAWRRYEKV